MNAQIDPVAALKALSAFANTSLRLLDDFAERVLRSDPDPTDEAKSTGLSSLLRGGVGALGDVRGRISDRERDLVEGLLDASPALAHSLARSSVKSLLGKRHRGGPKKNGTRRRRRQRPLVEALWVCGAPGVERSVVPLTQLLAAATARLFDEPAIVVTLGARPRLDLGHGETATDVTGALPAAEVTTHDDDHIVDAVCGAARDGTFHRIFFVDPDGRELPPPTLGPRRFHRIVYVTRQLPVRMPSALRGSLKAALFAFGDTEPGFSAFIPSVVLPVWRPTPVSWLSAAYKAADTTAFRAARIQDGAGTLGQMAVHSDPGWRIERDLCRMQLDLDAIGSVWQAWQAKRLPDRSFAAALGRLHPAHGPSLDRWARAVTNRQVGIGLSGGGACAYRAVPLLSILVRRLGVPIDVIGGVSGGAVIAAYFATYGLAGLRLAVERGSTFSVVVAASMVASRAIAVQVDADLGGTRVEELETRFVPVTTKLPMDERPPHGAVVVRGTCGAGVRVSGSAPGGFAPTEIRGSRFTDGFASTMVPARVLRSYGADLVLACNCIPGPGEGQPLEQSTIGRFLYHGMPLFGRMADAWVSIAYLFQETSRRAGVDADVFVEFPAEDVPLVEMTQWGSALAIAQRARSERGRALWDDARKFRECAERVGRRPK